MDRDKSHSQSTAHKSHDWIVDTTQVSEKIGMPRVREAACSEPFLVNRAGHQGISAARLASGHGCANGSNFNGLIATGLPQTDAWPGTVNRGRFVQRKAHASGLNTQHRSVTNEHGMYRRTLDQALGEGFDGHLGSNARRVTGGDDQHGDLQLL
jgi:hypothetical protein